MKSILSYCVQSITEKYLRLINLGVLDFPRFNLPCVDKEVLGGHFEMNARIMSEAIM